jgi:hypothetical protein
MESQGMESQSASQQSASHQENAGGLQNELSFLAGIDGKFSDKWFEKAPKGYEVPEGLKTAPDFWNLVKMTANAQKKLGYPAESLLVKPGKDWKDDQWNEFFSNIGRPESPDKYELPVKDGKYTPESLNEFKQIAHKAGLLPKQVAPILEYYEKIEAMKGDLTKQAEESGRKQAETELKEEWGSKFDEKLKSAQKFVKTFADEKDQEILNGKIGDDPSVLRVLANAASVMRNDALIGTGIDQNPGNQGLQSELDQIMKNPIYFDPQESRKFRTEHDRLVQRAFTLKKALS